MGIAIYTTMIATDILDPIAVVVELAKRISKGDLGKTVAVTRHDEIGQLLESMNDMVTDLQAMAQIANDIARGDLNVQVEPRSEKDVFGIAFNEMVRSLNKYTKELAAREHRFRTLCQTSPVGIFETNVGSIVTYANERLEAISGRESAQLLEQPWYYPVHAEDKERILADWSDHLARNDDTCFFAEFRIKTLRDDVCWCRCSIMPLRVETHERSGFVGTIEDITTQKEQADNEKRFALLEQREEFMATLTHDLKSPLIGANRVLGLMAENHVGEVTARQAELLLQVKNSNKRLLHMIQNLIEAYRFEKEAFTITKESTELCYIINSCAEELAAAARNRNIDFLLDLPDTPQTSMLDSNAITRVLQNLVDNSIKFTPNGGKITIQLRYYEDHLILLVSDTGLGISPEEQMHLFKRFSQGQQGRKYTPGSGLGLYICRQIVEAHQGTIVCKSESGAGCSFMIKLPLTDNAAFQPPAATEYSQSSA